MHDNAFQTQFLEYFDFHVDIRSYYRIKDTAFMTLTPILILTEDINVVYLPFKFMQYNLTYDYLGN